MTRLAPRVPHRFFILRHGETDANASGRIQGSADISRLTERGRKQAMKVGARVFGAPQETSNHMDSSTTTTTSTAAPIHHVYVSPLTRAQETLELVRQHAHPNVLPDQHTTLHLLREIDLYDWEGKHKHELKVDDTHNYHAWIDGDAHGFEVSGRKPILETWERAGIVWDTLRSQTPYHHHSSLEPVNTLLVCHGTLGQALLCTAFQKDESHFRRYAEFPNCGMVEIMWHAGDEKATSWQWHHPEPSERIQPHGDSTLA